MPHINEVNLHEVFTLNQTTFIYYYVLLDNESEIQVQVLAVAEQCCFEAALADRWHTCCKNIGQPP